MSEIRVNNRASNIELYRIIVMFMILCGHYVFNSDLLSVFWGSFSTFGVLLIHANTFVRSWLWNETIDCAGHCDKFWYAIIACVLVFSICSFIDWIRINTIEKYVFGYIDRIKNGFRS